MFKDKNKISYSNRGRTIEQNNSGEKLSSKTSKTSSKSSASTTKKHSGFYKKSK
ncbi:MAG: hypothetical protein IKT33_04200 [Clostridia bacterium]|nr:hypothetical protein [Clostridia bacterium]